MQTALSAPAVGRRGLSASTLKIIAAITMVIDHVGAILLPEVELLRIIGRISFPIFAYFIAEGCRYTRNKLKRFLLILGMAVLCETVYFFLMGEPDGGILMTFSFSILLIYQVQLIKKYLARSEWGRAVGWLVAFVASVAGVYAFTEYVLYVDYGIWGVLIPVWTALPDYKEGEAPVCFQRLSGLPQKLGFCAFGLLLLCLSRGLWSSLQSYSLLALPLLALYDGTPGVKGFKYGFYVFYPAHLVVLWLIRIGLSMR